MSLVSNNLRFLPLLLALMVFAVLILFFRQTGETHQKPGIEEKDYLQRGFRAELVPILGSKAPGRDNRVFGVEVEFQSFSKFFSWDTGAIVGTLVSSRLARELGLELLPVKDTSWRDSMGKPILVGEARLSFRLFNDTYRDYPVKVYREEVFPGIDGFLGTDIILRYQWTIDAESNIIVVREPGSLPGEALAVIPLRIENGIVFLPGKINGREVSFFLDTGLSDTTLPPSTVEELGIERKKTGFETPNLGRLDYAFANLQIDNLTFNDSLVFLMQQPMWIYPMLGQSVLNQVIYTLDPKLKLLIIHEKK
jgi:hypothetical protein